MTTPASPGAADPLVVRTRAVDLDVSSLLDLVPDDHPVTWLRKGEGLVGWGVAARVATAGATRFSDAEKWWSETVARAVKLLRGLANLDESREVRTLAEQLLHASGLDGAA